MQEWRDGCVGRNPANAHRDEVCQQKHPDLENSPSGKVLLIVRLFFGLDLERVGNEIVERKNADETDDARDQAKLSVGASVEKPDEHEHHCELQEIAKEIEAGVPNYGCLSGGP